jgi:hypothetical protein
LITLHEKFGDENSKRRLKEAKQLITEIFDMEKIEDIEKYL